MTLRQSHDMNLGMFYQPEQEIDGHPFSPPLLVWWMEQGHWQLFLTAIIAVGPRKIREKQEYLAASRVKDYSEIQEPKEIVGK